MFVRLAAGGMFLLWHLHFAGHLMRWKSGRIVQRPYLPPPGGAQGVSHPSCAERLRLMRAFLAHGHSRTFLGLQVKCPNQETKHWAKALNPKPEVCKHYHHWAQKKPEIVPRL